MRPLLLTLTLLLASYAAADFDLRRYLEGLEQRPHVELVDAERDMGVRSHLVALGAMSKIRGVWSPRDSERQSGLLSRFTWRIYDGVPSSEVLAEVEAALPAALDPQLLFSCDARSCGSSAQWANRVFSQRVLYGTASSQQYRAYRLEQGGQRYRLLLYASARTADRQYFHAELLRIAQAD